MVKLSLWSVGAVLAVVLMPGVPALAQQATQEGVAAASLGRTIGLAVAAAFAVGVSILGAGYAVGQDRIGCAAAAVEKPGTARLTAASSLLRWRRACGARFRHPMMLLQKI